ncbi:TPA: hypothetical protein ACK3JH_000139 [Mannheimia haemolytica]
MAIPGLEYIISLNDQLSGPLKEVMKDVDALGDSLTSIASIGAAFAGAAIGIGAFVDTNLTALDEIHQLSNVTGVAAKEIYELGKVAEVNGSSSAAAQASIEGLSKTIGEAVTGVGKGAKVFEKFGIKVKDQVGNALPFNDVLDNIMGKMSKMDEASQIAMLSKLGIDKTMIQTLRMGSKELDNARRKARALSLGVGLDENAKAAAEFKDALTLVTQVIKGAGEYISVRLAPYLQNIMELFTDWYIVNNDLVKESLDGITTALGNVLKFVFKTVQAIDRILQATIGWKGAALVLVAALALVKKQMILTFIANPVTKLATGILALILLIDDLVVYMTGGKSYFGKTWQPLVDVIRACQVQFAKFKPYLSAVYEKLKPYLPMIIGIVAGIKVGAYVLSGIASVFGVVTTAAKLFFTVLKVGILGNPIGLILTALTTLGVLIYENWDVCSAFFSNLGTDIQDVWGKFTAWLGSVKQWFVELGENVYGIWESIWGNITVIFTGVMNTITQLWQSVTDGWKNTDPAQIFSSLGNGVKNVFNNIFTGLKNMFIDTLNWIISQANKLGGVIGIEIPLIPTVKNQPVPQTGNLAGVTQGITNTVQNISTLTTSSQMAGNPTALDKPNGKQHFALPESTKAQLVPVPQGSVTKNMTMNQNNSKTVHIGSIVVNEATNARQLAQQVKDNVGLMA